LVSVNCYPKLFLHRKIFERPLDKKNIPVFIIDLSNRNDLFRPDVNQFILLLLRSSLFSQAQESPNRRNFATAQYCYSK